MDSPSERNAAVERQPYSVCWMVAPVSVDQDVHEIQRSDAGVAQR